MAWRKGNLHTHTNLSDGDSPPGDVARWYDDHGYDFLVISDHNVRFDPTDLQCELSAEGRRLLLLPGEELSTWWPAPTGRTLALHVNGYGTKGVQGPSTGKSVTEVLQEMVDKVVADGGMASVNHPNFWESVHWYHLTALRNLTCLEVYNGHHLADNDGTATQPPMEEVWDLVLAQGRPVWGLAVDDAHHFGVFAPDRANPGRGWVAVDVGESSVDAIFAALARGHFFASTGTNLERVGVERGELLVVADRPSVISFIVDGSVLDSVKTEQGRFPLPRTGYVRARIENEDGVAWTQPVFG